MRGVAMRQWWLLVAVAVASGGLATCVSSEDHGLGWPLDGGATDATTNPQPDATTHDMPERGPTPCLDARDPGLYPIRQLSDASTLSTEELQRPSTGLVIFDRSGSMSGPWDYDEEREQSLSKWDSAAAALLGAVTPVKHRVNLAALFFPQGDDSCDVAPLSDPRQIGFKTGTGFLAAWEIVAPLNGPSGGTPLQQACIRAEQALEAACVAGELDQRSYVMLLTDGAPNCGVDLPAVESILSHWRDHGIATYVFGLPGSEDASEILNQLSAAGGTETLIVPGDASQLESDIAVCM